jgi:hypothetical protein
LTIGASSLSLAAFLASSCLEEQLESQQLAADESEEDAAIRRSIR